MSQPATLAAPGARTGPPAPQSSLGKRAREDEQAGPQRKRARVATSSDGAVPDRQAPDGGEPGASVVEQIQSCLDKCEQHPIKQAALRALLDRHKQERTSQTPAAVKAALVEALNKHWFLVTDLKEAQYAELPRKEDDTIILRDRTNFMRVYENWNIPAAWLCQDDVKPVNVAELWAKDDLRRDHARIVFDPRPLEQRDAREFNVFRGLAIDAQRADEKARERKEESIAADVDPVLRHIRMVWCRNHQKLYDYVLNWLAMMLQRPWERPATALVLRGPQGAGKGIIVDLLKAIVGKLNFVAVSRSDDVVGRFNGGLKRCLLLFVDEAVSPRNQTEANRLKALITEDYITVEDKFASSVQIPNFLHIIIASNGVAIRPEHSDRRSVCIDVDNSYCGPQTAESKAYFDQIRAVPPEAFAKFLYARDLAGFNPRAVPQTDMLREEKLASASSVVQWWAGCLDRAELIPLRAWPSAPLNKADLFAVYQRAAGVRAQADSQFWKQIVAMLRKDALKNSRRNHGQPHVQFPSLADCKADFRKYQCDPEWPFASDTPAMAPLFEQPEQE